MGDIARLIATSHHFHGDRRSPSPHTCRPLPRGHHGVWPYALGDQIAPERQGPLRAGSARVPIRGTRQETDAQVATGSEHAHQLTEHRGGVGAIRLDLVRIGSKGDPIEVDRSPG